MDANYATIINNIFDDTFFGIYAQYAKHCIIKHNRLTSYGKEEQQIGNGIHCWKSDSLQIIGNSISGHRDGIYFEFVTNSIIWLNHSEKIFAMVYILCFRTVMLILEMYLKIMARV